MTSNVHTKIGHDILWYVSKCRRSEVIINLLLAQNYHENTLKRTIVSYSTQSIVTIIHVVTDGQVVRAGISVT